MWTKGRVDVSVTDPDGKVTDGYYVEVATTGNRFYSEQAALAAAYLMMIPKELQAITCYQPGKERVH